MIGLVDGNNFFVSCERVFDPSLEGKPVAVLSNNDGCCISRSNEFKALGIPMGTPYFQLKPWIEKLHLVLKSSNYELYGDLSRRVIATLGTFSPDVEQYSIDEAFIRVNLAQGSDYAEYGSRVRSRILQWVGIPCGVGFAPTKTLAKIANHIGKKLPGGVFVMPENRAEVLAATPVGEVWGIGRRLAPQLEKLGLRSAQQLAEADDLTLRRRFNLQLARTIRELRGECAIAAEAPETPSQSISCSRSFGHPVTEFDDLAESVAAYTARAAVKLRREKQVAAGINVYFQYYPEYGAIPQPGGFTSTTISFPHLCSDTGTMLAAITPKLRSIFLPERRYKKSGVLFFGLESAAARQLDLFTAAADSDRSDRLAQAVDAINAKFGRGTIFHLAEGIARPWAMKRELLTPHYTTSWDELPLVR